MNEGSLIDFSTIAAGGRLGYNSSNIHGFSVGLSIDYATEIWSTDLLNTDSTGNWNSKWEMELFDITTPERRQDILRLSKAFVNYRNDRLNLRIGRQDLSTPLMNKRDGRMMAFEFGGISGKWKINPKWQSDFGWIRSVGVRSIGSWSGLNEAIGVVGKGRTLEGAKANYQGKTGIDGVGFLGIHWTPNIEHKFEFCNFYLEGANHTSWFEWNYGLRNVRFGLQVIKQFPASNPSELYLQGSGKSSLLSTTCAYNWSDKFSSSVSATYITSEGKFLFPRELGREKVYTSMTRSWLEGFGNAKLMTLRLKYKTADKRFNQFIGLGMVDAPEVDDYEMNKYGVRDHVHLNIQTRFKPLQSLDQFEVEMLYVFRHNINGEEASEREIFNKTNYHQVNLIGALKF